MWNAPGHSAIKRRWRKMLRNFHCHMTHLKCAWNKIRSHGTFSLSVHKMLANLFDLWKIGSNRKRDPSKEEHPNSEMKKVKFEKFQSTWKKEFPWFKFDKEKKRNVLHCVPQVSDSSWYRGPASCWHQWIVHDLFSMWFSCESWEESLSLLLFSMI